jgi:hypothetical protein
MIVLSAGMQKSGTGWYFNMTNDLLVAAGYRDVRVVRQKFFLHPILQGYNCNMGRPTHFKWACLLVPHMFGNTFVVKTHGPPSPGGLGYLLSRKILKATYCYRDPRDVAVSAFEHGEKIRAGGQMHTFGKLGSIEASIDFVKKLLSIWEEWLQCSRVFDHVLLVRYEDLLADRMGELGRLANFLEIEVAAEILGEIAKTYQVDPSSGNLKGLHFNKGVVGRFREVMNRQQLDLCQEHFGTYLQEMGYEE